MSDILLEGRRLTRRYTTDTGKTLTACRGVDIALHKGETLGIVGESGCGKSTLLRLLSQLERPDEGRLFFRGEEVTGLRGGALRRNRRHIQLVFQDPSAAFFPRMSAGNAVGEPLRYFDKLPKGERDARVAELLALVQLPEDYARRYPHSMSGGQRQRLGIARALAPNPEILICDEATSALDVSVQQQIIELLVDIQRQRQLAMVFVCHDLALVQSISHRIMVMYLGGVVEVLPGDRVWERARHPYTKALLDSIFSIDMDFGKVITPLAGDAPSPLELPAGCPFCTRCPRCMDRCRQELPALNPVSADHQVACHLFGDGIYGETEVEAAV